MIFYYDNFHATFKHCLTCMSPLLTISCIFIIGNAIQWFSVSTPFNCPTIHLRICAYRIGRMIISTNITVIVCRLGNSYCSLSDDSLCFFLELGSQFQRNSICQLFPYSIKFNNIKKCLHTTRHSFIVRSKLVQPI